MKSIQQKLKNINKSAKYFVLSFLVMLFLGIIFRKQIILMIIFLLVLIFNVDIAI